ncbi:uncharacterized protein L201_006432 [Kwoniella dendrophila CBS 6074]|uniref:Xylanolytic transcriptional activator regulatory domain-containing protein n=1 Tax=Kwoniella dendrophila CBS 6074 TaxID=1295534 RepID=A0AAX4K182_9TREE
MVQDSNKGYERTKEFGARRDGPCKARKCRCNAHAPDNPSTSVASRQCTQCQNLKIPCTFNYQGKRRGPVPGYLRSRRAQIAESSSGTQNVITPITFPAQTPEISTPFYPSTSSSTSIPQTTVPIDVTWVPPILPPPLTTNQSVSTPSAGNMSLFSLLSNESSSPATSPNNPLDAVLPRSLRLEIISLFFRCVWPLLPVPHKPTFMADINNYREERAGQEEWTAMVFALLAFTLVQIPHHLVSITKNDIKDLVEKLSRKVKMYLMEDHHNVSLERPDISHSTVFNNLGRHIQSRALHGSNVVYCLQLGLNEESTYTSMDPVSAEIHRRLFWAVYCSDRSAACSENGNLLFNEDEINVAFPKDLDDDFITQYGYQEAPTGHASLMRGFVESCRLFSLGGNMLSKRMKDRSRPPSGSFLRARISELDELLQHIEQLLANCQPEMALGFTDMGTLATEFEGGFVDAVPDMLQQLIPASHADSTPFLVHSAHVRVTQQLFRFLTLQYREDLSQILYHEQLRINSIRPVYIPSPPRSEEQNKRKVLEDLLQILHGIPLEIHAINSFPGISKIRSVSASLLTSLSPNSAEYGADAIPNVTAQDERSMELLCDFLRLMATIERMYSLVADPSTVSTDGAS